ncbi:MAG TPA: OsmC family protein [Candidatus Acidoferrales bacterium]|nr:OsmC family protein [Candidatus Acidoferrales bacterium]
MPPEFPLYYTHQLTWTEGKKGRLSGTDLPALEVATPPEFDGAPGFWSPEQLFVASANACVMATFIAIAANSKLVFKAYTSSATGKLEKVPSGGFQITEIVIKARIAIGQAKDKERAERVLIKAEENCLVSRSMKSRVIVEPEIAVAE